MHRLSKLDRQYVWHPFTQMRDWLKREPIVIQSGHGATLRDIRGREYVDANASIWTNLHGHSHPALNRAISRQLRKIAHSSALGLANEPASLLAQRLVRAGNPRTSPHSGAGLLGPNLTKVFYSDNGSTALEVALKLSYEFARRERGAKRPRFLSLDGAYHGDTVGAVSLGHIDLFHRAYQHLLFPADSVMAPYCYRCRFNRARPERADAREYRRCAWECVGRVERVFDRAKKRRQPYAAMILEPLMQGAAGMIPQPAGWLSRVAALTRAHGALLIADEVMTGMARTTSFLAASEGNAFPRSLFGCHKEGVQPDFLAVAKGLSGGYVPMAATLTTPEVFDAFLGDYDEFKTFFHGHSFTGNQVGAAASLASLDLLETTRAFRQRQALSKTLSRALSRLWDDKHVGDIRQVGLIAGVELVQDWVTRAPFSLQERVGIRVCEAMTRRGVLTRPVGSVIVIMPPYCMTSAQLDKVITALADSIEEVLG